MPAVERLSGPNRFTQRVPGGTAEDELAGVAFSVTTRSVVWAAAASNR